MFHTKYIGFFSSGRPLKFIRAQPGAVGVCGIVLGCCWNVNHHPMFNHPLIEFLWHWPIPFLKQWENCGDSLTRCRARDFKSDGLQNVVGLKVQQTKNTCEQRIHGKDGAHQLLEASDIENYIHVYTSIIIYAGMCVCVCVCKYVYIIIYYNINDCEHVCFGCILDYVTVPWIRCAIFSTFWHTCILKISQILNHTNIIW